jgi:hypothetical protein
MTNENFAEALAKKARAERFSGSIRTLLFIVSLEFFLIFIDLFGLNIKSRTEWGIWRDDILKYYVFPIMVIVLICVIVYERVRGITKP